MMHANIISFLCVLAYPVVSANPCLNNGACIGLDETSFVQVKHVVRQGEEAASQKRARTSEIDLTSELAGLGSFGAISTKGGDVPAPDSTVDIRSPSEIQADFYKAHASPEKDHAHSFVKWKKPKASVLDESLKDVIHPKVAPPALGAPPTASEEAMLAAAVDEELEDSPHVAAPEGELLDDVAPLQTQQDVAALPMKAHPVDFLAESSSSEELELTSDMRKMLISAGIAKKDVESTFGKDKEDDLEDDQNDEEAHADTSRSSLQKRRMHEEKLKDTAKAEVDLLGREMDEEIKDEVLHSTPSKNLATQESRSSKVNGKWEKGRITINGTTVTLSSGETANLEQISSRKISMKVDGMTYIGKLWEDGNLHWNDGTLWSKHAEETPAESLGKLDAHADKDGAREKSRDVRKTHAESTEKDEVVLESSGSTEDDEIVEEHLEAPKASGPVELEEEEEDEEEEHAESLLAESLPDLPAGCSTVCIGTAPFCGGNDYDCTRRGLTTVGYTRRCTGNWFTCISGWKVRCAVCPHGVSATANNTLPVPVTFPPTWTAPPLPVVAPAPTVAPVAWKAVNPFIYVFNSGLLGNATVELEKARANLTLLKYNVSNHTALIRTIERNISLFSQQEKKLHWDATQDRGAAVSYAEKVVQANITAMRATRAREDAFYAEKAASNEALNASVERVNARAHKVYYKKLLIDKKNTLRKAEHALTIGQSAVNNAMQWYYEAQRLEERHRAKESGKEQRVKALERYREKIGRWLAVKCAMEHADYIASGGTRGISAACE
jgi:hypothetical protein